MPRFILFRTYCRNYTINRAVHFFFLLCSMQSSCHILWTLFKEVNLYIYTLFATGKEFLLVSFELKKDSRKHGTTYIFGPSDRFQREKKNKKKKKKKTFFFFVVFFFVVLFFRVSHRFQQSFSHIATVSGCGRVLNAHFSSAASLKYHTLDT